MTDPITGVAAAPREQVLPLARKMSLDVKAAEADAAIAELLRIGAVISVSTDAGEVLAVPSRFEEHHNSFSTRSPRQLLAATYGDRRWPVPWFATWVAFARELRLIAFDSENGVQFRIGDGQSGLYVLRFERGRTDDSGTIILTRYGPGRPWSDSTVTARIRSAITDFGGEQGPSETIQRTESPRSRATRPRQRGAHSATMTPPKKKKKAAAKKRSRPKSATAQSSSGAEERTSGGFVDSVRRALGIGTKPSKSKYSKQPKRPRRPPSKKRGSKLKK